MKPNVYTICMEPRSKHGANRSAKAHTTSRLASQMTTAQDHLARAAFERTK